MTFLDLNELRSAIDSYAISKGVNIKIIRSEKRLLKAICEEGCPFTLYASRDGNNVGYKVKTLCNEHWCGRVFKNPRASVKWLAKHFKEKIQERLNYSICEMKNDVERELKVHMSLHKCKRAKKRIIQHMDGSFVDEFSKLEAYYNELKVSDPGSDISVEISNEALEQGKRVFRRMYLCFNAAKVGWKVRCRPLIGVDGTFLKGKARGILLTAVGLDANDSLYPLAFALVDKENGGLQHVVTEILSKAEHRLCARHIYANWSKRMFDGIRVKMMEKWAESKQNVRNWKGNYSPKCLDLFEANRLLSSTCRVFFNEDEQFEVTEGQDRHTVCLTRKVCTCRAWDLTGIPCQHAIHAMYYCKLEPLTHISRYYHKDTYIASYRTKFAPVRGKQFWDTEQFIPMLPPPERTLSGRLRKKKESGQKK
ncbi:uncharacterized protein LOC114749123 [Neltuma alba]|uniref:uncharacterized protein LOC114749123 n=1 Tax=Neltuma alba TaxID=207710 RepID=UPI0010A2C03B|nr:uncharacterized protein LOC114749123 [Prosopis alba]